MRRKYGDCIREDGNCVECSLVSYGMDCHGKQISKLEWARRARGWGIKELAERAGISSCYRKIQKIEAGDIKAENLSARVLLALADALEVDPHDII